MFCECQIEENMTSAKEGCNFLVMPDPPWMHRVKYKFWFHSGGHQRHTVKGVEHYPNNSEKNKKSLAFAETGESTCVRQRKWKEIRMKQNQLSPAAILNSQQVRTQHCPETSKRKNQKRGVFWEMQELMQTSSLGWGDHIPRLPWLHWSQDSAQVGLPKSSSSTCPALPSAQVQTSTDSSEFTHRMLNWGTAF